MMGRIGILTSGGNASASNAVIHAVCKAAYKKNIELVGFYNGYSGIIDNKFDVLKPESTLKHALDNGSFLKSARSMAFLTDEGFKTAVMNLHNKNIDSLIVIGGNGSLAGAEKLAEAGISIIGVPATIDNDVSFTDITLGTDTACNVILEAVYRIREGADSILMEDDYRVFIIEVMGRKCGYLTLASSIAADSSFALVPEIPYDINKIADSLVKKSKSGDPYSIIMLAEGSDSAENFGAKIKNLTGIKPRIVVLGHTQRGGQPTYYDLTLAARFGYHAVEFISDKQNNVITALQNNRIVPVDLKKVTSTHKDLDPELVKLRKSLD